MVTNSYYRGAQGVVLVYDIADKESFKALDRWIEELDTYTSKETNKVIIGNKVPHTPHTHHRTHRTQSHTRAVR
jgi:GTPase SAR1 family protein